MEMLFLRIVSLSLSCSAVLLPLLLLARRLHHRYAARTCYLLWLLLALRLVIPIQAALPRPAVIVEAPSHAITLDRPAAIRPQTGPVQAVPPQAGTAPAAPMDREPEPPAPARTLSVTQLLAALWLAGGAAFLLWQMAAYGAARRSLLRRSGPADGAAQEQLDGLRKELGVTRRVALRRVRGLPTPMMLGLLRPVILLPGRAMEGEELGVVLRHELCHLRRHDVAYKALLLLTNALHWFNPLVWWMSREGERNLELCCDDDVVRGRDEDFRRRYGEILLHTANQYRSPALSTHFCGGKAQLKGRLTNLFQKKKNSAAVVCLVLACALLLGSLVACETRTMTPEEALDALEASAVYEDGALSFTIPKGSGPAEEWNIHIAGRAEYADGMSMSLHYLEDEQWVSGETYTLDIAPDQWAAITELTLEPSRPMNRTGPIPRWASPAPSTCWPLRGGAPPSTPTPPTALRSSSRSAGGPTARWGRTRTRGRSSSTARRWVWTRGPWPDSM